VKFSIKQIPPEGLAFSEELPPEKLDLETEIIRLPSPLKARAEVFQITNAVSVRLSLEGAAVAQCSRCLEDFQIPLKKNLRLNFAVSQEEEAIDLDPEIREEIILSYPLKPLCKLDCRGICAKCGTNLNVKKCNC
jgi:uncharacterized protein